MKCIGSSGGVKGGKKEDLVMNKLYLLY